MDKIEKSVNKRITEKQNEVKGYTTILNSIIRDNKLTHTEHRVLMIIISHYNKEYGFAFPGNETIQDEASISKTTRLKVIESLIKKKKLKKTFRNGTSNAYTFPTCPFPKKKNQETKEKKKKPFYKGQEMRFSANKWWVIDKYGDWLEYAGPKKDIEYK